MSYSAVKNLSMKQIVFILFLLSFGTIATAQLKPVHSDIYHWKDLPIKKEDRRESRKILEGSTSEFEYFEIHATTQWQGAPSRPAHTQKDIEELIIIKEGTMKCTIGVKTATLGKGSVLLVPPLQQQKFENVGEGPLTYYVLMFRSKKPMNIERSTKAGGSLLMNYDSTSYTEAGTKGTRKFFERATAMCDTLEMHVTTLKQKGPSHAPHQHVDSEIILMIEGETEMTIDGKKYQGTAGDLYLVESGKMHGITNTSDKACSYFAFRWR
jgi:mannose-6-phosphate isomerase-like protein (cupin superfamily)